MVGLISSWILAGLFYRTWQQPLQIENGAWVRLGFAVLGLELVSVLAGVFVYGIADPEVEVQLNDLVLQGNKHRALRRRLLVFFSGLFAIAGGVIAWVAGSWWMLLGFSGMMVSRASGMLNDGEDANRRQFKRFSISLVVFFLVVILTVVIPFSPDGLTPEVMDQIIPNRGTGLWTDHPERILLLGLIYFGIVGVIELIAATRSNASTP